MTRKIVALAIMFIVSVFIIVPVQAANPTADKQLLEAAQSGDVAAAKAALDAGANVVAEDFIDEGMSYYTISALEYAQQNRHEEVAKLLIEHGAITHAQLLQAAQNGNVTAIQEALTAGADMNARNYADMTPLHLAAEHGHMEAVKLLINKSAKVDASTKHGETPLLCTSKKGHAEIAAVLIDQGADVNGPTESGWTPLHSAALQGHLSVIKVLISKGANVNARDNRGHTPLYSAEKMHSSYNPRKQIISELRSHGAI